MKTERLYYATGLERNRPILGELRFAPSRSAALATRRLDRYLGNSATLPIEIAVSAVEGTWTDEETRRNCRTLTAMMKKATGASPTMWGPSIVGCGLCHYVYESGREGDWPVAGFSPRKGSLSIYCLLSLDRLEPLMKRLADVDTKVLERLNAGTPAARSVSPLSPQPTGLALTSALAPNVQ